jgi:hypothetical protein
MRLPQQVKQAKEAIYTMKLEYVITIMLLAVLVACSVPVSAECCADLSTAIKGTGDVYVGGGHGLGNSPYQQDFDVPSGNVKWARLYTGVWASGNSPGWINISFCNGTGCTDHDAYVTTSYTGGSNTEDDGYYVACGYGNYWYYWNVTDIVNSGTTNDATVTTKDFDVGWVSGIILIVVYEDGGKYYWVNQGYAYLGTSDTTCACRKAASTTTFTGTMGTTENATLWTGYFAGEQSPENDILEFNGHRFDVADTADGSGATGDSSWTNKRLDVDKWDIHQNWINATSNSLKFIRDSDTATRAVLAVFLNETIAPDLTVTDIDTLVEQDGQTPTALVANQNYAIDVTVQNIGNKAAGAFDLTFEVGAQTNTTNLATGLGAGDEDVSTYYWTPPSGTSYNLVATADAGGAVTESDEDNNATTKPVTVLPAGTANLVIESGDITFHPAHANHAANNNTIVRVKVRNEGTGDAGSAGSMFDVQLVTSGPVTKTTWVRAMSYRFVEFETTLPKGSNSVTVNLDSGDTVTESNEGDNSAGNTANIVVCRILDTHHYGDDSTYNGPMSGNTDVEMFDVVKLAPEGANPVELLKSVANSTTPGDSTPIKSVDGLTQNDTTRYYWYPFVNGIPVPWGEGECGWETYPLHEDDTIRWEFLKYVNSPSPDGFKVRPVMDYPEPFIHGYNGTVHNTIIVYPDELCYSAKADAVETGLTTAGVSGGIISTKAVGDVTSSDKANNNLILLGTPSNNPIIADINSQRLAVGLPVYFDGSCIIDDSDDTSYVGSVIESCDNPYGGANWKDTGPSVWLAAASEDYWAYKAADLLANDPDKLDRFWAIREPYLVPTWDGTNVILDWGNWTGTCASFNIYITNNLTAGFPATPSATTSSTSWTDTNAGDDDQRYYKVTCGATGVQIEGNVGKITYELKKGAIYGVNWITLPSTSPPITDADAMIKSIPGITHLTGDNVKWWNFTSQQAESYFKKPSGYGGTNFPVKPARGYEVSIGVDTTWTVVGWVPPKCQIKLKKGAIYGVNWIGMPFDATTDDADAMIKSIPGITHLTGDNVKWWNFTSQQAESYFKKPSGYGGTNFPVKPARGYEVSIGVDTTWTPQ